jgi:hypothetical protein
MRRRRSSSPPGTGRHTCNDSTRNQPRSPGTPTNPRSTAMLLRQPVQRTACVMSSIAQRPPLEGEQHDGHRDEQGRDTAGGGLGSHPNAAARSLIRSALPRKKGTAGAASQKTTPMSPASVSGESLLLGRKRGRTGDARYRLGYRQRCRRCRLGPGGTGRHRGSGRGEGARLLLTCHCAESTDADHGTDRDNGEKLDVTCFHDRSRPSTPDSLSP